MSRTVRDGARLMDLTEDKSGKHYPPVGLVEGPTTRRLKIGFIEEAPGLSKVAKDVSKAQQDVASFLEDLGHTIVDAVWPLDTEAFAHSYPAYFATRLLPLKKMIEDLTGVPVTEAGLLTGFQASFAAHAATVPEEDSVKAEAFLESLPERFKALFDDVDLILCPVMSSVGIKNSVFDPNETYSPALMHEMLGELKFTGPVNFAGNPAMSVPLTWHSTGGLPIGSHFIAPIGDDRILYELAYELEEARPWKGIWAPYSIKHIPV